jgi:ferrous iron transport protein B
MEMPPYKIPSIRNIGINVWEKVTSFVFGAGKIIIIVSLLLWLLSSYGPPKLMKNVYAKVQSETLINHLSPEDSDLLLSKYTMENSYAGILGKAIEPAIAPLGFDWKIGIALITSFAAREVFVSSMSTLYSIGNSEDEYTITQKMSKLTNAHTGKKLFDRGTSIALLLFYLFALQCMSTLAVVKKETGSWKFPVLQFIYMGCIAYASAWVAQLIF